MALFRWLRRNAEHYLLVAAQDRVGARYGVLRPRPPAGVTELVWLRMFAPVYAHLPWRLRSRVLRAMPGSHRGRPLHVPRTEQHLGQLGSG